MKMMQLSCVGVYLMALGLASTGIALDGSWNVDASGSWTNELNWSSSQIADGAGSIATFNIPMAANRAITLHRDQTIANLVFGAEGFNNRMLSNSELLINGSPKKLTLDNGLAIPLITCWALAPVNSACRISSPIVSPKGFIKNGNGTLWLNAANPSLGGTIELRQGRIFAQTAGSAFGTASIVVSNTCYLSFWAGGTYTNAFELNGPGTTVDGQRKWTVTADNSTDLTLSGPIQLTASSEFGVAANASKTLQVSGPVSGPGGFVAAGNGRVIMMNPKDFSGGIVVSNTSLVLFGNSTNCLGAPLNKTNLITVLPGAAFDLSSRNLSQYYPAAQGYTITASGYGSNSNYTNTYGAIYGAIVSTGLNNSNYGVPNLNMIGDTWIGNNDNKFYLAGKVSGPYSLIQVGNGTVVNQGSFADEVKALIVSNGTFATIQRMGKVEVSVHAGATLSLYTETALTNKLYLYGGAFLNNSGNRNPKLYGDIVLQGTSTITVSDPTKTMNMYGNISGEGSFRKIDMGKLILSGTNTFSGSMWVTNGIVQVNSTNSLPITADLYLYTASTNATTPIAQLNLNYTGTRTVRRFFIDDELQTRMKSYHASNSKLTITGLGAIYPLEGTNPKGLLIRFY